MTELPQPFTPAARRQLHRLFRDGWREADRARREASFVLKSMYRNCLRGRRA